MLERSLWCAVLAVHLSTGSFLTNKHRESSDGGVEGVRLRVIVRREGRNPREAILRVRSKQTLAGEPSFTQYQRSWSRETERELEVTVVP